MRFLITAAMLLGASSLSAQFPSDVRAGSRVRIWLPDTVRQEQGPDHRQLLRGTVESVNASVVNLRIPGTMSSLAIPRSSVRRLDVSRGVSRAASMVERAVGGAIGGAITLGVLNDPDRSSAPRYRTDWQAAGVGAAWGGGIGAAIGLLFPYERWRRVIH